MSILEIVNKKGKHYLIKPKSGFLDLTVLSTKQAIKSERLSIKKFFNIFINYFKAGIS